MEEDVLQLFSIEPKAIELENGKTAYLRRLSAEDRLAWLDFLSSSDESSKDLARAYNVQAALLVITICDKQGVRRFADGPESLAKVQKIDERIFNQLTVEAFAINGLGEKSVQAVKKE